MVYIHEIFYSSTLDEGKRSGILLPHFDEHSFGR